MRFVYCVRCRVFVGSTAKTVRVQVLCGTCEATPASVVRATPQIIAIAEAARVSR